MHQRRLAGAIVTDDADALAGGQRKIGAVQSPDGAVGFFDPGEIDEISARVPHGLACAARGARFASGTYFMFALIAAMASAWVYSWLATPPFGIFGNSFSKSSW